MTKVKCHDDVTYIPSNGNMPTLLHACNVIRAYVLSDNAQSCTQPILMQCQFIGKMQQIEDRALSADDYRPGACKELM